MDIKDGAGIHARSPGVRKAYSRETLELSIVRSCVGVNGPVTESWIKKVHRAMYEIWQIQFHESRNRSHTFIVISMKMFLP